MLLSSEMSCQTKNLSGGFGSRKPKLFFFFFLSTVDFVSKHELILVDCML